MKFFAVARFRNNYNYRISIMDCLVYCISFHRFLNRISKKYRKELNLHEFEGVKIGRY
tara:strand:- start:1157 stop:1330 length:174 start_codon:yes stop_codon:yes gene_type:complete